MCCLVRHPKGQHSVKLTTEILRHQYFYRTAVNQQAAENREFKDISGQNFAAVHKVL
jgi:hypothetical protein